MINIDEITVVVFNHKRDEFSVLVLAEHIENNLSNVFNNSDCDSVVVRACTSYEKGEAEAEKLERLLNARENNCLEEILANSDIYQEYVDLDRGEESYKSLLDDLEENLEY